MNCIYTDILQALFYSYSLGVDGESYILDHHTIIRRNCLFLVRDGKHTKFITGLLYIHISNQTLQI